MELKSQYDFRTLRKAQSKVVRRYNIAAKAVEKLGLKEEDNKTIEAILTKQFDEELKVVTDQVNAGTWVDPSKKGEQAAAGGEQKSFV